MTDAEQKPRAQGDDKLLGRIVAGKYKVLRLLGRGGMGAVYEAEHTTIGRRVAIKFVDREFAQDERVVGRFAREARAASAIESDHIVGVFDAGTDDGHPYIIMELLRGEDVGTRLRRVRKVPLEEALHIVAQMLRGLARAHAAGIVHRDLKPDNVLLVETDDDPLFVKIVDFGISKMQRLEGGKTPFSITAKGVALGTPLFMSPEQAQARPDVDERSDLYSVGAILFECLTGRPPHVGETEEQIILGICMTDAPDVRAHAPEVPEAVAGFLARALKRDRAERFQSAPQMLAALREVAPDEPAAAPLKGFDHGATVVDSKPPFPIPEPSSPPPGSKTDASWSTGGQRRAGAAPLRKHIPVIAAALGATVTGVLVTVWIVTAMRGPAPADDGTQSTAALASSSPAASASATTPPLPSTSTPTAASTPTPSSTAKATSKAPSRPAASGPAKATSKPLDIQRDLP